MKRIEQLSNVITDVLGTKILKSKLSLGELTIEIDIEHLLDVMNILKNNKQLHFEQCVDVCGVDYQGFNESYSGLRFAVVYHLLSLANNWRIRVRTFAKNDSFPVVPSIVDVYASVNWFEREAFDMYGIAFEGHPDLRRILTDYGFVGHPLRKDFPVSGFMEMKYDEDTQRVVYQPLTIEPRENTPRVIREENYGRN